MNQSEPPGERGVRARSGGVPGAAAPNRRQLLLGAAGAAGAVAVGACQTEIEPRSNGNGSKVIGNGNAEVTLDQWYHQYGEDGTHEAVRRYAKQFTEANSDIAVKVGWTPGDYAGKLSTALLRGGPDVYEDTATVDKVRTEQSIPLDDLLTEELRGDFNPRALEKQTVDGKLYAIPMLLDTGMLYYRKSMLDKAGVRPPRDVDEVIAAAKKLTDGNVKGLFLGNDGGAGALLTILPWSAGAAMVRDKAIAFDTDETAAAYEKLVELDRANVLLLGYTTDWYDPSAFTQGLCAMQWGGLWMMPAVEKELGDDFDVVPWPPMTGVPNPTAATFIGGWSSLVNGKSKHIEESKELVRWMWLENAEIQRDFNLSYGFHIPARRSIAEQAKALRNGPARAAVEAFEQYGQAPSPYWNDTMAAHLTDAVSRMVKRDANISEQLTRAAERADDELQKQLR